MRLFLMFQGSLNTKIRFLGQSCDMQLAYGRTDTHTQFSFNLSSRIGPILVLSLSSLHMSFQWVTFQTLTLIIWWLDRVMAHPSYHHHITWTGISLWLAALDRESNTGYNKFINHIPIMSLILLLAVVPPRACG